MLRYWHALRRWADPAANRLKVTEALGPPPLVARRGGLFRRVWCKRVLYPRRVRNLPPADVYHLLDHGFAHLLSRLPAGACIVATVHDLAPLDPGEGLTAGQLRRFRQALACLSRAKRIVVPSRFTAGQVAGRLRIPMERISILPMGVDPAQFTGTAPVRPGPYVISVGGCAPRKNLGLLPAVLGLAAASVPGLSLVRVGDPLPGALRGKLAAALGGRVFELGRVDDRTLGGCYAGAVALLLPSKLEGFGLPVLEAMACGCPVVCSRAASLPEAGGDAALYFDPEDAGAAAGHLFSMATQAALREEVVERGHARARLFSWSAHAAGLVAVYRAAVQE
jgi:alpha-1,3-rhamnosyl/mannosyltransferase